MNYSLLNGLALAYIGDTVYESRIRKHLIDKGLTKVNDLHKNAVKYTSAKGQYKAMGKLASLLTEEETDIFKRGRNTQGAKRKNTTLQEYQQATGFEALVGYLYLMEKHERLEEIIKEAISTIEGDSNEN